MSNKKPGPNDRKNFFRGTALAVLMERSGNME